MPIKISGGRDNDDYTLASDDIVNNIKQFEETINLLKNNHFDDKQFFFFYLITILSDYNIIHIIDIFNKDDTYLVNFYINKIIKYYESCINDNPEFHLHRIQREFNVTKDLKLSLYSLLLKMNKNTKDNSIDQLKKNINSELVTNKYKFKQMGGFKITPFKMDNLKVVDVIKTKDKFVYLCNLLEYIININNQYLDYFKEYSVNNEHNINEIYNLTNQI